eukprot:TRINITY_DN10273_c1_g1_i10.p1 TRINITY_DN10273_c1_g1~~TRINITY_DN10273_c1_g1_i10.p1  ORF type:complete len:104 (-),score=4.11 TRINITY_DN10273_c1_g1_i10:2667-2978(-)
MDQISNLVGHRVPQTPTSILSIPAMLLFLPVSCLYNGYYGLKLHANRVLTLPNNGAIQRLTYSRLMTSGCHPVHFHYTALEQFSIPNIHIITKQYPGRFTHLL